MRLHHFISGSAIPFNSWIFSWDFFALATSLRSSFHTLQHLGGSLAANARSFAFQKKSLFCFKWFRTLLLFAGGMGSPFFCLRQIPVVVRRNVTHSLSFPGLRNSLPCDRRVYAAFRIFYTPFCPGPSFAFRFSYFAFPHAPSTIAASVRGSS